MAKSDGLRRQTAGAKVRAETSDAHKLFRRRLGAKSEIALGAVRVLIGICLLIWGFSAVAERTQMAIPMPYLHCLVVAGVGLFLLIVGGWRIYTGARSENKRWLEDPLEKK